MKFIQKQKEPSSLTQHRASSHANYVNYPKKDDLRKALLSEQGNICCYCMQRIKEDKMKIEHWKSQSNYPQLQLIYNNLMGVCRGNEGQPKKLQHCDTSKADYQITINPTHINCEQLTRFSISGEIISDNEDIQKDLNIVLKLNTQILVKNRQFVLDEALRDFYQRYPKGTWTKAIIQREINKWINPPYREYCQIVIFYLRKKLSKCKN